MRGSHEALERLEWTRAGQLRHPRYLGLRDDKRPTDVVREQPAGGAP